MYRSHTSPFGPPRAHTHTCGPPMQAKRASPTQTDRQTTHTRHRQTHVTKAGRHTDTHEQSKEPASSPTHAHPHAYAIHRTHTHKQSVYTSSICHGLVELLR
mmetsp:Transcript_26972/g.67166  ORF Transcript_26972/g.67166 Transcript_26972/m.67166 type:complete len:102 (-) Transcript_26972:923-1228(-)